MWNKSFIVILFLFSMFIFNSCGKDTVPKTKTDLPNSIENLKKTDLDILRRASLAKIESFTMTAKRVLRESIRTHGLVESIDICSDFVPELSMSDSEKGIELNRISEKNRNKYNAPDSIQSLVLAKFNEKETSPEYFEDLRKIDGDDYYLYYKPIYVAKNCLGCHGNVTMMSDSLQSKLNEFYPNDKAVSYNEGEFRGLFEIRIKYPDGLEYSKILSGGM